MTLADPGPLTWVLSPGMIQATDTRGFQFLRRERGPALSALVRDKASVHQGPRFELELREGANSLALASDKTVRSPRTCVANSAFASTSHGEAQNRKVENRHFPFPKQLPNNPCSPPPISPHCQP